MSDPVAGGHYRLMFPTDFLAAPEFKGKDVALTIRTVSIGELPLAGSTKKEKRPVVTFEETPKKLVLNKTNAKTLAKLFGVQTSEWVGKRVAFYPTMTKFGKDDVECIRVRERLPPPKASKTPAHDPATGDGPPPDDVGAAP